MVKLVHGLHQESLRVMELEVGLYHGCLGSDHRSARVVKLIIRLYLGSPRVVKLVMRLHQGYYIREHEMSRGGKASNRASPQKI